MLKYRKFYFFLSVITILIIGFFLFRSLYTGFVINRVQQALNQRNLILNIGNYSFNNIVSTHFENISISENNDTLLYISNLQCSFSISLLLRKRIPLNNIVLQNGFINISAFQNQILNVKNETDSVITVNTSDINKFSMPKVLFNKANRFINYFSELQIKIFDFRIYSGSKEFVESLIIEDAVADNGEVKMNFYNENSLNINPAFIHCIVSNQSPQFKFTIQSQMNKPLKIPVLSNLYCLYISTGYSEAIISLNQINESNLECSIHAKILSPSVYHWRIGTDTVKFDSLKVSLTAASTENKISIINESYVVVNKIPLYTNGTWFTNSDSISFETGFDTIEANIFFNSLPNEMFANLNNIEVEGNISYKLNFDINFNLPDSLTFKSTPIVDEFRITNKKEFLKPDITGNFIHKVIENDRVKRNVIIADTNKFFTAISNISPLLIYSVLTAEDGTFFFHKGFNHNALRQSIATNIKEQRFARGGSTISMQLVKNIYLNRNKNITRKVEEAILVWLIENQKLVSKERMLEVYLNIIEWGPDVYGITEAAQFYFDKYPSELTLEESIYLSAIIPRPKYFKYTFDKNGQLRDYMHHYFNVVSSRLFEKGIITEADTTALKYEVHLKNRSLQFILPDSINQNDAIISPNELITIPD